MQNEEKCRDGKDIEQRETSPMWGLFTNTYDTEVIVKATFEETYITMSLSSSAGTQVEGGIFRLSTRFLEHHPHHQPTRRKSHNFL